MVNKLLVNFFLTSLAVFFKKSPSLLDFPVSEHYDGPLDTIHRSENIPDVPLEVTSYPSELSYKKLPVCFVPVVEETEKKDKPSLKSRIAGLFKKSQHSY
ncbi:hypothetical protein L3Y34_016248 [Caenorhabditis briggsae]|uniref:Uncharacterized protein n=1 Tax=Caenorhabditis briggsae TaxID=6238 RepID=A0AAE9J030_CAEBR|nr:hypothetical protein L3Y34_016248 [Caenorhabditis briggsae]